MIPRLLHPVDIEIEQISKATTTYDQDTREAVQQSSRGTKTIVPGQVRWRSQSREEAHKGGMVEGSDGYVLFRRIDLDTAGITLQRQDRFSKLGHVETDVYIVRLEHTAHYPDQGGPTLVKAYFEDRGPSRQTRG